MTLEGLLENLVSDVLFVLLAIVLGWVVFVISRRAKLLRFFGVDKSRRIAIYLSNLRVKSGGSIGIDGRELSYRGSTAAFGEMVVANRFRDLFNYFLPSLSESPGLLSRLLISDVQVQLLLSPLDNAQIERSAPFIALGSPAYNIASQFIEQQLHSKTKFGTVTIDPTAEPQAPLETSPSGESFFSGASGTYVDETLNLPTSGSMEDVPLQPPVIPSGIITQPWQQPGLPKHPARPQPSKRVPAIIVDGISPLTHSTYGFVERITDRDEERFVYYAAGISELATAGAANYLISEWAKLHRKYGTNTDFLVMLRFEPHDYRRWSIIFEK